MGHLSFATQASSRLERGRQWGALTRVEEVEIDDDRESSLRGLDLGDLRLCLVSMGKHRVGQRSARDEVAPAPVLKFIFQEEGAARIRQHSHAVELHAGQWCGLRKNEPYAIEAPGHSRQLAFALPCWRLRDSRKALEPWREARSFRRGAGHILHAAASAAVVSARRLGEGDARLLGTNLIGLLEIALRAEPAQEIVDLREERRRAAIEFIERHLAETDLDVGSIARALGCSSRTIHKLFEGETLTVAREIWDRRLERCRLELVDPAMARRSITEIAHEWGFSDSQHFSRAFKHRFGSTPREYRAFAFN